MNPYEEVNQVLYPTIKEKVVHSIEEMTTFHIPDEIAAKGRAPVVCGAIRMLQADIGSEVAIGSYVLGPFTLAGQLMDLNDLLKLSFKNPELVNQMLDRLADVIVEQSNDLEKTRADVGLDTLVFGNVDAYNVLVTGSPADIEAAVCKSLEGGVDAVWPSCDIWPTAPLENMKAFVEATKKYGAEKWFRNKK